MTQVLIAGEGPARPEHAPLFKQSRLDELLKYERSISTKIIGAEDGVDRWHSRDPKHLAGLRGLIRNSQTVLWKADMWAMATRNCEAFEGSPLPTIPWLHYWMLDAAVPVVNYQSFGCDRPVVLEEILCGRISNTDGQQWLISTLILKPDWDMAHLYTQEELHIPIVRAMNIEAGSLCPLPFVQIAAAASFINSTIAALETHVWPRPERRRAHKANEVLPLVKVVALRRREQRCSSEETYTEWKHRWIVNGHWRKQWYAKAKEHRLIFIAPHIKGPEGKPLLAPRESVYAVVR